MALNIMISPVNKEQSLFIHDLMDWLHDIDKVEKEVYLDLYCMTFEVDTFNYYENFSELLQKGAFKNIDPGVVIHINAETINTQWANLCSQRNYYVVLSVDGSTLLKDKTPLINSTRLLAQYGVNFGVVINIDCVSALYANDIYAHLNSEKIMRQEYLPSNINPPNEKEYTQFLCNLFDDWYRDIQDNQVNHIRYFDNLISMIMGLLPDSCRVSGKCPRQFVIEPDGSVYPCFLLLQKKYCIGNLHEDSPDTLQKSCELLYRSIKLDDAACSSCKWFRLCNGGCLNDRLNPVNGRNRYCKSYQAFFEYVAPRLYALCVRLE